MKKTKIRHVMSFGMIAAIFSDYLPLGNRTFPSRNDNAVPEQFLKLFFKTIGVVRDCLQSFTLNSYWDKSVMCDPGRSSGDPFLRNHCTRSMILFLATTGKIGYAFKEDKSEDEDLPRNRLYGCSGKISLIRYRTNRMVIPVCSQIRSPLKQTGLYEKGDYHQ